MAVDTKTVKPIEWAVLGCAALIFILSFFDAYVTASAAGLSGGENAWNGYAVLGLLLLFAAAAIIAVRIFAPTSLPQVPVGWGLIATVLAGLGALLLILRALTYDFDVPAIMSAQVDIGPGWSGWAIMILAVAETVLAALIMQDKGETAGWDRGSTTPQTPSGPAV